MLTDKCKKDFEEWLLEVFSKTKGNYNYPYYSSAFRFGKLPLSMQWGILQDFFISKHIGVYIYPNGDWIAEVDNFENTNVKIRCYTHKQARKAAIEKANEIYNS